MRVKSALRMREDSNPRYLFGYAGMKVGDGDRDSTFQSRVVHSFPRDTIPPSRTAHATFNACGSLAIQLWRNAIMESPLCRGDVPGKCQIPEGCTHSWNIPPAQRLTLNLLADLLVDSPGPCTNRLGEGPSFRRGFHLSANIPVLFQWFRGKNPREKGLAVPKQDAGIIGA